MEMSGASNIKPFTCKGPFIDNEWQKWKRALDAFLLAYDCRRADLKKAWLLHLGGPDLADVFENQPDPVYEDGTNVYQRAIAKLDSYFAPKKNKLFERHVMRQMTQGADEFSTFVIKLQNQASKCEFGNYKEEAIVDQIVFGCNSKELKNKCLAGNLDLSAIMNMGVSLETVEKQLNSLLPEKEVLVNPVNRVQELRRRTNRECYQCGKPFLRNHKEECKAVKHKCSHCKKVGHFESKCYSKKRKASPDFRNRKQIKKINSIDVRPTADTFSDIEDEINYAGGKRSLVFQVGGVKLECIVDSGSDANLMSEDTWMMLRNSNGFKYKESQVEEDKFFVGYLKKRLPMEVITAFETTVCIGSQRSQEKFYVIKDGRKTLVGDDTATRLGVLKIGIDINVNCVERVFPRIKGVKIKLDIDETVQPVAQPLRRVPIAFEEKIEGKIKELLELKIIEPVTEPSEWVSPIVPVGKSSGELRLCIDMRRANKAIKRELYPLPTMETMLAKVKKSKFFSKIDLKNAYHQLEITEDTRYITTFITAQGMFRYTRLMFGISCAPEKFQKTIDHLLADCDGTIAYIDDILVFGNTQVEHDMRLKKVIKRFQERGVLLNKSKCQYSKMEVVFMGHRISADGFKPIDDKIEAVKKFRNPINADEVRSFLGLVNYHSKFIPNVATISKPLRDLLKLNAEFKWEAQENDAFEILKREISNEKTLGYFDPKDETQLVCDASPVGLGAVLLQKDRENKEMRAIAYASRSLTETEQKYYHTEKEALSLVWGVEKFKYYLLGIKFYLVTDCKPLQFLFGGKSKPCARLERWIMRLQAYNFSVVYRPGKTNLADPLSRLSVIDHTETYDQETEEFVYHVVECTKSPMMSVRQLRDETASDNQLQLLKMAMETNNWTKQTMMFKPFEMELGECDGIFLRGSKLIPPKSLRKEYLKMAHEGHMGINSMKKRLRRSVWWPGMDRETEEFVKSCRSCTLVAIPSNPEPMKRKQLPLEPWEDIAIDYLGPIGTSREHVLVAVDYYSRFFELSFIENPTAEKTVHALRAMIGRNGYPKTITADNGPQFNSEVFKQFCVKESILWNSTTPYWPQANGEVERINRNLKKRIKISLADNRKWKDDLLIYQAAYHATPHSTTGKPPGEIFHGRFRDKLPVAIKLIDQTDGEFRDMDMVRKYEGKEYSDRKRRARTSSIEVGDKVVPLKMFRQSKLDPNFESEEHLVIARSGGEAIIKNAETGKEYRRHVNHLKKVVSMSDNEPSNKNQHSQEDLESISEYISDSENSSANIPKRPGRIAKQPARFKDYIVTTKH